MSKKAGISPESMDKILADSCLAGIAISRGSKYIYVNTAFAQMHGYTVSEVQGSECINFIHPDHRSLLGKREDDRSLGKSVTWFEMKRLKKDGQVFWAKVNTEPIVYQGKPAIVLNIVDISESKRAERLQEIHLGILDVLNRNGNLVDLIRKILTQMKQISGCSAVGVRLKDGDDYPYYETNGFDVAHLQAENKLCLTDDNGQIVKDSNGNAVLECMCGNIIQGRFDPGKPFFTKTGSFWTNCTTELLASTTEADRQARTRNKCNGEGYASVALIPLKSETGILGLLQLNDFQPDRFTPELISYYETIAQNIATVLNRKLLADGLKESLQRYQSLTETTSDFIWEVDAAGKYTYCSPKTALELWGYRAEDLLGKSPFDRMPPEDREEALKAFHSITKSRSNFKGLVFRSYDSKGRVIFLEINGVPFFDSSGNLCGYRGVTRDITERTQTDRQIKDNEERMRLATQIAGIGTYSYDFVRSEGQWSPELKKIWGYRLNEEVILDENQLLPGIHPDDRQMFLTKMTEANKPEGDGIFELEYRILRPDGKVRWLRVKGKTYFTGKGKNKIPSHAYGAVVDFTKRKEIREELELRAQLLDHASDLILLHELYPGQQILYVNRAMCKVLGYSREELHDLKYENITLPSQFDKGYKLRQRQKAGDIVYESYFLSKDGSMVSVEITANRIELGGEKLVLECARDITERKRSEQELERHSQLLDMSTDSVFLYDFEGNFQYVNEAMYKARGYTREEIMGIKFPDIVVPEYRKLISERRQELLEKGSHEFESAHFRKNGSVILVEIHSRLIEVDGGKLILAVARDITERKEAEDELRQSEERFRTLFFKSPIGVAIAGVDSKIFEVNEAFCHMLGYSRDELLGTSIRDLAHPDDLKNLSSLSKAVINGTRTGYNIEKRYLKKDGTVIWVNTTTAGIRDGEGNFIYGIGMVIDITERKRVEEALRLSERKYQSLVEDTSVGVTSVNLIGEINFANKALCHMMSYRKKDLLGKPFIDFICSEDRKRMKIAFGEALAKRKSTIEVELAILDAYGHGIDVHASVTPIKDDRGISGFNAIVSDVTSRNQMMSDQKKLEQKAQMASRLASIGEMAAGIAHEINNPLTGVIGYAGLLLEEDLPDPIKKDLITINDSAQRAAGVVRRLLTFARQSKPLHTQIKINDLIENTLELRDYHLKTNNIEVMKQYDLELPATIADGAQLQQVFLNLITNAESAMQEAHGKGTLVITTCKKDNNILVSFKDDGRGITKENMEKLFTPFFTTKDVGKGTGLGLSICYGIITEHGGRIWAESKSGKGATFFVELPVVVNPEQLTMGEPEGEEAEETAKVKVLVVDDEEMIREFMERVLTEEGHEVDMAGNGEEALKKIEKGTYRLILLDMKMPGISGMEVYKQIKKIDKTLAKQVVFVTGDVMGADTEAFLKQSRAPYVTKPFDAVYFKQELKRLLGR